MEFTIKSRKDKADFIFICNLMRGYIRVRISNHSDSFSRQICEGGKFAGETLFYSGVDEYRFNDICRRWYRQYRENDRE